MSVDTPEQRHDERHAERDGERRQEERRGGDRRRNNRRATDSLIAPPYYEVFDRIAEALEHIESALAALTSPSGTEPSAD